MCAGAVDGKLWGEGGQAMIKAVRHFLWYLDHHSAGGRHPHRPSRPARVDVSPASKGAGARQPSDPKPVPRS
jgi:hypothetical protein